MHCQDVTAFAVLDGRGLLLFYEPFTAAIAEKVLENIESSIRQHPRQVVPSLHQRIEAAGSHRPKSRCSSRD